MFATAVVVLALTLAAVGRPLPISADLGDGHTASHSSDSFPYQPEDESDWRAHQLAEGRITRNLVDGKPLVVCSENFETATMEAIVRWNTALKDDDALERDVLTFGEASECKSKKNRPAENVEAGVAVVFVEIGTEDTTTSPRIIRGSVLTHRWCSDGAAACVRRDWVEDNGNWRTQYGRIEVIVDPEDFCRDIGEPSTIGGCSQADDDLYFMIVHELGHALSLADYRCNLRDPNNSNDMTNRHPDFIKEPTVMDTRALQPAGQDCRSQMGWGIPTARDVADYKTIYTPGAVQGLMGTASGQTVTLTWNPSEVFVKTGFKVERKVGEDEWDAKATVEANAAGATLTNQPGGVQSYQVVATTKALAAGASIPASKAVTVNVQFVAPTVSIRSSDITTTSVTLRWSAVAGADGYEVKRSKTAAEGGGETEAVPLGETARSYPFTGLESNTLYTFSVLAKLSGNSAVTSDWSLPVSATTKASSPPQPPVDTDPPPVVPPPLTTVSVNASSCYPGAEVNVSWEVRAGRSPTVRVNGDTVTENPTSITCRDTVGRQPISVTAQEGTSTTSYSRGVTVLRPPVPVSCLTGTAVGRARYKTSCAAVRVSDLLSTVHAANSDIGGIWRERDDGNWDTYQKVGAILVPGSVDYTVSPGDKLLLIFVYVPSMGAAGASSVEPPSCPDAVKPKAGLALISFVDNFACVIVRGGGAVQVSRGDYTLNLTLPAGRDWQVNSQSGAFAFEDLATGGWIYLNAAAGAELWRYDSTSASVWHSNDSPLTVEYYPLEGGLPALLDAIVASATVPAAAAEE